MLLDGADIAIFHLLQEVDAARRAHGHARRGGVGAATPSMAPSMESIRYFRPTGEPDAPYDSYKEHL